MLALVLYVFVVCLRLAASILGSLAAKGSLKGEVEIRATVRNGVDVGMSRLPRCRGPHHLAADATAVPE